MTDLAVYIHWPYCVSKCPYCDFASRPQDGADEDALLQAYLAELAFYADQLPARRVGSIYFGGGTPSLMKPATLAALIRGVEDIWPLASDVEITIEANPVTADIGKFHAFRTAGVNRLSLGVQSFRDDVLRFLGRAHDASKAIDAIDLALRVFPRFSLDLIYAYAGQTLKDWENDLSRAARYGVRHLSLYQLTIEPGTAFGRRVRGGEVLTASEDLAADLYDLTQDVLEASGLPGYEISNHAVPGEESRHNLTYWRYGDYVGLGPGAHGRVPLYDAPCAVRNQTRPDLWRTQVLARGHGIDEKEELSLDEQMTESILMGLRLAEGIDSQAWEARFERPLSSYLLMNAWRQLEDGGFVEKTPPFWRATARGRKTLNALLPQILPL